MDVRCMDETEGRGNSEVTTPAILAEHGRVVTARAGLLVISVPAYPPMWPRRRVRAVEPSGKAKRVTPPTMSPERSPHRWISLSPKMAWHPCPRSAPPDVAPLHERPVLDRSQARLRWHPNIPRAVQLPVAWKKGVRHRGDRRRRRGMGSRRPFPRRRRPVPAVTYALLPGHWPLDGARHVWVPPETSLRPAARAGALRPGGAERGHGCQAILGLSDMSDASLFQATLSAA